MRLLDTSHPFFRPLWRRAAIVALCFAWALFELSMGEALWALAFCAIGAYCAWALLVAYSPGEGKRADEG